MVEPRWDQVCFLAGESQYAAVRCPTIWPLIREMTAAREQDPILVTSLSLGSSFPLLSNARIRPADGFGGLVSPHCFPYHLYSSLAKQASHAESGSRPGL